MLRRLSRALSSSSKGFYPLTTHLHDGVCFVLRSRPRDGDDGRLSVALVCCGPITAKRRSIPRARAAVLGAPKSGAGGGAPAVYGAGGDAPAGGRRAGAERRP